MSDEVATPIYRDTLILANAPASQAIGILEVSKQKVCLVVDEVDTLLGTVTDGDIRRGILNNIPLETPIAHFMNKNPRVASSADSPDQIKHVLTTHKIRHIPVVDADNRVIDVITLDDLLQRPEGRDNWIVLMAGGLGSRLRPLTDDIPKPMLEVGDKPLLETIIQEFTRYNFSRFYISINYRANVIAEYFGDGSKWNAEIRYIREKDRMGTAGALSLLDEEFSAPIVVMNADILTKVNFDNLVHYHVEHDAPVTMCVREFDFQIPYGVVEIDDNKIERIAEKPVEKYLINAGVQVLDPEVLKLIPKHAFFDFPELIDILSARNTPASVFPIMEYWMDIGRFDDYRKANADFFEHFL